MIPINASGNCTTDLIGTGNRSCDIKSFGDIMGYNLHPKGWSLNVTTGSITAQSWADAIKAFNVMPVLDVYDFTQDTPDNDRSTSSTGKMSIIRVGKTQFTLTADGTACSHRQIYDKRGMNRWDISFMFETGILFALSQDSTTIGGFDMGMYDVGTFKLQQGTDPQQTTVTVQLVDSEEFNTRYVFIPWSKLGVNLSKTEGVVEAVLSYSEEPTTSNTFAVKVAGFCNSDDPVLGLDGNTNWRLGGTQATPRTITTAVYRPATQDYLITLSGALVADDTVQPMLAGTSYNVAVDEAGGIYKGKAPLFTVPA